MPGSKATTGQGKVFCVRSGTLCSLADVGYWFQVVHNCSHFQRYNKPCPVWAWVLGRERYMLNCEFMNGDNVGQELLQSIFLLLIR